MVQFVPQVASQLLSIAENSKQTVRSACCMARVAYSFLLSGRAYERCMLTVCEHIGKHSADGVSALDNPNRRQYACSARTHTHTLCAHKLPYDRTRACVIWNFVLCKCSLYFLSVGRSNSVQKKLHANRCECSVSILSRHRIEAPKKNNTHTSSSVHHPASRNHHSNSK